MEYSRSCTVCSAVLYRHHCHLLSTTCPNTSRYTQVTNDKCTHFFNKTVGHDDIEQVEEGGCFVTCDKASTSYQGWTENTWMDSVDLGMSQRRIVTADSLERWTDCVGRIVAWSDRQDSEFSYSRVIWFCATFIRIGIWLDCFPILLYAKKPLIPFSSYAEKNKYYKTVH